MRVAQKSNMKIDQRPPTTPWKTGLVTAQQVEAYQKAIGPLQEGFAAAKAARQGIFKWMKGRSSPQSA
jgi:hypothetical protein